MADVLTPEQEARIREIIREELEAFLKRLIDAAPAPEAGDEKS